jgi:hypothetical protein
MPGTSWKQPKVTATKSLQTQAQSRVAPFFLSFFVNYFLGFFEATR